MSFKTILLLLVAGSIALIIVFIVLPQRRITTDVTGMPVTDAKKFFEGTKNDAENGIDGTNEHTAENTTSGTPILITNGVKHIVSLEDIHSGGPPKDGIPSIDNPKFISIREADTFLNDNGLGIAVSFAGVDRFYPNQILVWHEIVNDTVGEVPVVVTYCPLCGTGIVFDPVINGKRVTFGTSGKLWNSNLVMYDRLTDTYWSQVLGRAIVGELAGTKLTLFPHQNMSYADWKQSHPDGEVLSRDTGFVRDYTVDPYGNYYMNRSIFFPVGNEDSRFHPKSIVYGIEINNQFKAYPEEELIKTPDITDTFAGIELNILFDTQTKIARFINSASGGEIVPVYGFWFSWIAAHPDSDVYIARE